MCTITIKAITKGQCSGACRNQKTGCSGIAFKFPYVGIQFPVQIGQEMTSFVATDVPVEKGKAKEERF